MEILALEVILNTCKSTEKPPKPKTNEQITSCICILIVVELQIKEIPFVTSIKPVSKPILTELGILKKLSKLDNIIKMWLVCNIDIIIENRTTKPPIIRIVLIAFMILLDKTSPKLQKEREELPTRYSALLKCCSLDFPHHLNRKPYS